MGGYRRRDGGPWGRHRATRRRGASPAEARCGLCGRACRGRHRCLALAVEEPALFPPPPSGRLLAGGRAPPTPPPSAVGLKLGTLQTADWTYTGLLDLFRNRKSNNLVVKRDCLCRGGVL